jgi:PadR family transcriptional regulator, regulatory protein PadR
MRQSNSIDEKRAMDSEQHDDGRRNLERCGPSAGRIHGFIQPWLLLLLLQKPSHGYELMERLGQDEAAPCAEPGLLYRTLRNLEDEGMLRSSWETGEPGAARRLYEVTPAGVEYLHAWAVRVRFVRRRLDRFLAEYAAFFENKER